MSEAPDAYAFSGGLPRLVGDGLLLRWATVQDSAAIVDFNRRLHRSGPDDDAEDVAFATSDLVSGRHPTTTVRDFTVVVDQHAGGRIVSCMLLLSQTWAYEGLPFALGRPEWVATEVPYRRQGLVRAQFSVIHGRSAARGELVQGITGIPWYYRQFGYALALDRGGSRWLPWPRLDAVRGVALYRLRPATIDDIPHLDRLYRIHCASSLISRVRDAAQWRWELAETHAQSMYHRTFALVEDAHGQPSGYIQMQTDRRSGAPVIHELAAAPGHSLRAVALAVAHTLQAQARERQTEQGRLVPEGISVALGAEHPVYEALASELEHSQPPSAWYVRVADVAAFLRHIRPILTRRVQGSVMDGYSGTVRLSFFRGGVALVFEHGALTEVGAFQPAHVGEGDACFPDTTFLHLLFGHRSLDDLRYAYADCLVDPGDVAVLLPILFPLRHSQPVMLG